MSPRLLCLLPLALLLVSCIDGDEEIWLERDGSGRLEATYKMPGLLMEEFGGAATLCRNLEEAVDREPGIRLRHIGHEVRNGRVVLSLGAEFDDVRTLATFPKKHLRDPAAPDTISREEVLFGEMNLEIKSLAISFDRRIDLSPILDDRIKDKPERLANSTFRYTVHLPAAASRHNATGTSDDGRTLHWEFLLREHTTEPMSLSMSAPLPIPWWVWFTVVLLVAVFLLLLVWAAKYTITMRR